MTESTANSTVFHTHQLDNGLQIVAQPMPDFESVAASFFVRTGSRDEPDPNIAGVSHFLEHMVFKGRSEEHTSELQSHSDLVCRLLLEKKKPITESHILNNSRDGIV